MGGFVTVELPCAILSIVSLAVVGHRLHCPSTHDYHQPVTSSRRQECIIHPLKTFGTRETQDKSLRYVTVVPQESWRIVNNSDLDTNVAAFWNVVSILLCTRFYAPKDAGIAPYGRDALFATL